MVGFLNFTLGSSTALIQGSVGHGVLGNLKRYDFALFSIIVMILMVGLASFTKSYLQ